jgi:hypothetical protein
MLACLTEKQQPAGYILTPVIRERDARATLLTQLPGMNAMPMWEITIHGLSEGGSRVEHRTALKSVWGHPYGAAGFLEAVTECEAEERRP